jgi:hypothetical protein
MAGAQPATPAFIARHPALNTRKETIRLRLDDAN